MQVIVDLKMGIQHPVEGEDECIIPIDPIIWDLTFQVFFACSNCRTHEDIYHADIDGEHLTFSFISTMLSHHGNKRYPLTTDHPHCRRQ